MHVSTAINITPRMGQGFMAVFTSLTFVTLLITLPPEVTRCRTDLQEPGAGRGAACRARERACRNRAAEGLGRRRVPLLSIFALAWVATLAYFTIFFGIILKKAC